MRRCLRNGKAEILKMKRTFLFPIHVLLPVLGSVVFLLYYQFSGGNERGQISGFIEVIGVALPFVVSLVCAGNIRLEEQNHFQVLLGGYTGKADRLAVKIAVLMGMGMLTIFGAVFLFASGYHFLLEKTGISLTAYIILAWTLFLGSIPLYLEHLLLNLAFSGTVSQCVGVAQFLLSALFLTGLGEGRWQFFPSAWSARGAMLVLQAMYQEETGIVYLQELRKIILPCLLLLALICGIIGIWFHYYEGRQCND